MYVHQGQHIGGGERVKRKQEGMRLYALLEAQSNLYLKRGAMVAV